MNIQGTAQYYTAALQKAGLPAEFDDVFSEIFLVNAAGTACYANGGRHEASLDTYLSRCVERRMKQIAGKLRAICYHEIHLPIDVDSGIDTEKAASMREAIGNLNELEAILLSELTDPSTAVMAEMNTNGNRLAAAVATGHGLPARKLRGALTSMKTKLHEAVQGGCYV